MPDKFGKFQKCPEFVRNFIFHLIFSFVSLPEGVAAGSVAQNEAGVYEEEKEKELLLFLLCAASASKET